MAESGPAFPKLIALPGCVRPVRVPVARFAEVKSAADLPDRLFFGRLQPAVFQTEKKGWRAEWRGAEGGRTRLRYAGQLSSLELKWREEEAVSLVTAEAFSELAQTVENIHPAAWMQKLAAAWQPQYNLRVFPHREEDAVVSRFPDGYRVTLILPAPADRLPELFELHQALQDDTALQSDLEASVRLHYSVVNYLEGCNPPMLAHPAGLVLQHVNLLGTPAAEAPVREVDPDGETAWTLRRSHYLYSAHLALFDAPLLVERLYTAGFIGPVGAPHELGAALLPYGYSFAAQNAWWFDAARTRRVFYPTLGDTADQSALVANSSAIWNKALLRDAQKAAEQCKAETAQAFVEGMRGAGESDGIGNTVLH